MVRCTSSCEAEGREQSEVLGEVSQDAQLNLVVVRDREQPALGGHEGVAQSATLARAHGMLCRLGLSEESRPVRATTWENTA